MESCFSLPCPGRFQVSSILVMDICHVAFCVKSFFRCVPGAHEFCQTKDSLLNVRSFSLERAERPRNYICYRNGLGLSMSPHPLKLLPSFYWAKHLVCAIISLQRSVGTIVNCLQKLLFRFYPLSKVKITTKLDDLIGFRFK